MKKGLKSVPTLSAKEIAQKHGIPVAYVLKQIAKGVKVEKEHTKSTKEANEIARDHLGERPDYYIKLDKMEKSKVSLHELGEYDNKGGSPVVGDLTGSSRKVAKVDEGKKLEKAKKAVMAGVTAANLYTAGDVAGKAAEGRGSPKADVVRMATTLPGAAGWAASGVHYAKKAYDKVKQMKEDKDPCWKGYEMVGMKKKGARKVPNCVPVEESEMEEGYASIGHAYDWAGDVNRRAKFYGNKPKPTTTKNDEKDDTYKDSNKNKKVKFAKTVKEAQIDEISAELVGRVSNARAAQGKAPSRTLSRAINKKFIAAGGKIPEPAPFTGSHKRSHEKSSTHVRRLALKAMEAQKAKLKEAAIDAAHGAAPQVSGLKASTKLGRNAPTEISSRGRTQGLNRTGNTFRSTSSVTPGPRTGMRSATATPTSRLAPSSGPSLKPTSVSGPQVATPKTAAPTAKGSFGSGGGSMKPTSVGGKTSFSQGGSNIGSKMAASKQTSNVVKGMTNAGRAAVAGAEKAAASAVGRAAGALSGPVGAAVGAAAPVLGAAMKQSHETGHKSFTQHAGGGEKTSTVFDRMRGGSQGRSVSSYEKDVLTPKASEAPKPKVDAPTPPSRPDYFSKGQAFSAARGEAGGGSGKFSYDNKSYQTNVKGEPYKPATQLKQTSIKEELMDTKDQIQEAIGNIMEENLHEMKENFLAVLQEKAVQKLEERKKDIASEYFAQ